MGASSVLWPDDRITSSHRGHGDAIAKGFAAIRQMSDEQLQARVPGSGATDRDGLLAAALEEHVYRTIAELFGKDEGYCRGRGGGMHIADFSTRPAGRQRHRRRQRAHRHRRGHGPALPGHRRGRLLLRGRRRLRQRRGARVAQLRRAVPVVQLPGRRPPGRPAHHLPHPEQPLRHDPPHRRRGHGRARAGPARRRLRRRRHARRGRQRHGRAGRARRGDARRGALPRRRGPRAHRVLHLPLLRPLALRPAQRVPHARGGGGLAGRRPHREPGPPAGGSGVLDEAGLAGRAGRPPPSATPRPPSAPRRPPTRTRPTCSRSCTPAPSARRCRPSSPRHGSTRPRPCPRSPRPACCSATPCARPWSRR